MLQYEITEGNILENNVKQERGKERRGEEEEEPYLQMCVILIDVKQTQHMGVINKLHDGYLSLNLLARGEIVY